MAKTAPYTTSPFVTLRLADSVVTLYPSNGKLKQTSEAYSAPTVAMAGFVALAFTLSMYLTTNNPNFAPNS